MEAARLGRLSEVPNIEELRQLTVNGALHLLVPHRVKMHISAACIYLYTNEITENKHILILLSN